MVFRVWMLIVSFLTATGAPERRPTGLTDEEAALVMRRSTPIFALAILMSFIGNFAVWTVSGGESAAILAILGRGVAALLLAVLFVAIRKPVGRLIVLGFAANRDEPGAFVLFMQRYWPAVYILLLILQFLTDAKGYLSIGLSDGNASAVQRSFGAFVIAPFLVAGLRIWSGHLCKGVEPKNIGRILGIFSLLEGATIIATGIFIMYAWNIDPFATDLTGARRILPGLVSAAIVTVIGISLWRTASALLTDGQGHHGDAQGGPPEEEGGAGGSRIETVMPVIRAVSAAFIATVTVLLALSSLGVQIAPLLAGAGILGLAIGFGAQKVVEDVISGVLYLIEDAFRKGEYIETAQGKGVVEAIMLRSVRLRHHLGPVFTIPFSAMGTIQNHSRDWVTVKLKFEVSPDQDLEKVRKLIKKVGQQLLEDPELEGQFLAPLKSQGAVALVGANYQIGVKFTSEPGKQFLIRRKALNAIQKAFSENGIELAAPRVIVDAQDHDQVTAAAAKAAIDAQQKTPSAPAEDR
jgi:small-conductance mechanosensitive channel